MRVGLLGIGRAGQMVLQASAQVPGVSIVAAFDVDSDKTASLPSSIKVTQRAQELLADPDIDVVYVATPTNLHYHHAKLVASYGKDLLLEKPAAEELSEYTAIKKLAFKSKINAVVAFHALFGSEVNWFRSEYLSGPIVDLPKIKSVTAQFFDPYVLNGRLLPQAFSLQNSLMDSGPNALSIFFSLFPDCRVKTDLPGQNTDNLLIYIDI